MTGGGRGGGRGNWSAVHKGVHGRDPSEGTGRKRGHPCTDDEGGTRTPGNTGRGSGEALPSTPTAGTDYGGVSPEPVRHTCDGHARRTRWGSHFAAVVRYDDRQEHDSVTPSTVGLKGRL